MIANHLSMAPKAILAPRRKAIESTTTSFQEGQHPAGDATEAFEPIDEEKDDKLRAGETSASDTDSRRATKQSDHIDHDRLSKLIPGYVKPDDED